jgi:hypothetical protein
MVLWGKSHRALLSIIFMGLLSFGCASKNDSTAPATCSSRLSPVYSGPNERPYCSSPITHTTPVIVTGTAFFESRPYAAVNCTNPNCGIGNIGAAQPIRFAEVVAYNSGGNIVQCGETDNSGAFSLQLPTSNSVHKIRIYTRADNTHAKVSVLNCPEENDPYYIETSVTPNANRAVGTITAEAANDGPMLGAAFHIFEQIVIANEFLSSELSTCGTDFTGCETFTVAPKVQIYWTKGFNPNVYFGNKFSGLSFYLPSFQRLFILGGISGDIYNSDTDHFDSSIILHEYGHFLEDVFTVTDSPGGPHSANEMIDPRLAWSEGWGNFIQAAIRDEAHYRDSEGTPNAANPTSTSSFILDLPIETADAGCSVGDSTPGCDLPDLAYEGNFREFAVTRALWDIYDSAANPDSANDEGVAVNNALDVVWAVLTSHIGFMLDSTDPNDVFPAFRNMGLLHQIQMASYAGATNWTSIRTDQKQGDNTEYAYYVDNVDGCGKTFTMVPFEDGNYTTGRGSFDRSHLVGQNDFLHYYHDGGAATIRLHAQTTDNSGGYTTELEPDIDLYLYNESGRFGYSSDVVSYSADYWDNNPTTEQTETITLGNLAKGHYLINVKLYTGRYLIDNNTTTNNCIGTGFRQICENDTDADKNYIPAGDEFDYGIEVNGVDLCPAAMP